MADSQYIIDVAAEMPDGGATTAQLDELSASLISAGANAETLEAAALQVSAQLRAAGEASAAANDALAEGNARYSELERAALKAAQAAEKAAAHGKLDPAMARTAHEAAQALEEEGHALLALEAEAALAAAAEAKLATTQKNLGKLSSNAAGAFSEQAAAAKKSVREAEGFSPLAKQFHDLSDAISTTEGASIVATGALAGLAVGVAAVTAAVIAGTIAIAALAVGLADAKREAALTDEAAAALHPELAALAPEFAAISAETGASSADLRAWKKQLDSAKVAAADIPAALRAMALEEAALGKGRSAEFLDTLKETKGAAGEAAKAVNEKLGGIVAKRMMGLDAQTAKLKKNFGDLFGGLNIEPVLSGLKILVDLFDKNTAAGEAMKFLFETVFQPIIDQAENAAYVVEAFILGFLIGLTKLYIALKPAINAVKEFFGFEDTSLSDVLDIAKIAGEAAVVVFVGFIAVVTGIGVAIAAAYATMLLVPAAIMAIVAGIVYLAGLLGGLFIDAWHSVTDFFASIDLAETGTNIVKGLIDGIVNMGPNLLHAITGVVGSAIDSVKSILGIASPSKVFAEIGGFTGEGFANGVEDAAPMAQDAMAAMVEPPDAGGFGAMVGPSVSGGAAAEGGGAGAAPGGRSGGKLLHIENLYLAGAKATQADAENIAEAITKILEGDAAALAGEAAA